METAREWLHKFEHSPTDEAGRKALADALSELVDLETTAEETPMRNLARNLIGTYRAKVEEEGSRLLAEKDTLGWEPLLHWHGVMGEFHDLEIEVSDNFRTLRSQLGVEALVKQAEQLSTLERERLIELLGAQIKGAE